MSPRFIQADRISEISAPGLLSTLVGEIRSIEREPMKTVGFSGTRFERLYVGLANGDRLLLVLKHVHPEEDATVWRTGGMAAREARLLNERTLDRVWNAFDAPYLAYAFEGDVSALLMRDLSPHLFSEVREPIQIEQEEALIDSLARLHALFWQSDALDIPWLAKGEFVYGFLAPGEIAMEEAKGRRHPIFTAASEGWEIAQRMLPASVARLIALPPKELSQITRGLPRTLLHGDAKVANFAVLPNRRVAAFDWSNVSEGCATIDLGWYLAISATRLTRSKEDLARTYRHALERHLGSVLPEQLWEQMYEAAILCGAMVLLWNKALNVKKELPGAVGEWNWWVRALEQLTFS